MRAVVRGGVCCSILSGYFRERDRHQPLFDLRERPSDVLDSASNRMCLVLSRDFAYLHTFVPPSFLKFTSSRMSFPRQLL